MTIEELIKAAQETIITDDHIEKLNERMALQEAAFQEKQMILNRKQGEFLNIVYTL